MATVKEWLNERPGAKLDEEEAARGDAMPVALPFDPRTEVSADAKYLLRNLIIWFVALPAALGIVIWLVTR